MVQERKAISFVSNFHENSFVCIQLRSQLFTPCNNFLQEGIKQSNKTQSSKNSLICVQAGITLRRPFIHTIVTTEEEANRSAQRRGHPIPMKMKTVGAGHCLSWNCRIVNRLLQHRLWFLSSVLPPRNNGKKRRGREGHAGSSSELCPSMLSN